MSSRKQTAVPPITIAASNNSVFQTGYGWYSSSPAVLRQRKTNVATPLVSAAANIAANATLPIPACSIHALYNMYAPKIHSIA